VLLEMRGSGSPEIERALRAIRQRRYVAISLPHGGVALQLILGTDLILTMSARGVQNVDHRQLLTLPPTSGGGLRSARFIICARTVGSCSRYCAEEISCFLVSTT